MEEWSTSATNIRSYKFWKSFSATNKAFCPQLIRLHFLLHAGK